MYRDFKELLLVLNAHRVKYLVVGGYAVSLHAEPRATKDLDVLIGPGAENSKALFAALAKFGAPLEGLSPKDFMEPGNFFRMGTPPVMVDILSSISGVDFEQAWQRRVETPVDSELTGCGAKGKDKGRRTRRCEGSRALIRSREAARAAHASGFPARRTLRRLRARFDYRLM